MAAYDRNTHGCRSNPDGIVADYFVGFLDHFHLFLGISVVLEYVNLWDDIQIDLVWIRFFASDTCTLIIELLYRFHTGSCDRLVSRYDHPFYDILFMQGFQYDDHLYRRTIRVGNDLVFSGQHFPIYLRHDELFGWVHTPGG